jgi:predicted nucleic acid-binding protein
MSAFVLDTSIALKWFLEDEGDRSYSPEILESITAERRSIAPLLWYYEIASTLLVQVRRKRIGFEKILIYSTSLMKCPSMLTRLTGRRFSNSPTLRKLMA